MISAWDWLKDWNSRNYLDFCQRSSS